MVRVSSLQHLTNEELQRISSENYMTERKDGLVRDFDERLVGRVIHGYPLEIKGAL